MTATPGKIKHLVNPIVEFGLSAWIASKYSPEVKYHFMAPASNEDKVMGVAAELQRLKDYKDSYKKLA